MANYNARTNARLYRMAAALPDALYRKAVGAYFGSLHGTLNHLWVTDSIWMRRLTGRGEYPNKLGAIAFDDLPDLHLARRKMDESIVDFVQGLEESKL